MICPYRLTHTHVPVRSNTWQYIPFTNIMTFRGTFSLSTISFNDVAPTIFVPFASLARKLWTFQWKISLLHFQWLSKKFRLTLSTVRLYAQTLNPFESMLRIRFWPITANPIKAISALLIEESFYSGILTRGFAKKKYSLRHFSSVKFICVAIR